VDDFGSDYYESAAVLEMWGKGDIPAFCCDLGQVTGGLVIRRAKIELMKIVSKEYIESLKRNYLKSD
jgi:hypothetical protein